MTWCFGKVKFDEAKGDLTVAGKAANLDRNSLTILAALLREAGTPLSKDALLKAGWPGRLVHENSLSKAIGRLRQALGEDGRRIEAVYGNGYRFTGPVEEIAAAPTPAKAPVTTARRLLREHDRMVVGGVVAILLAIALGGGIHALWSANGTRRQDAAQERQVEALLSFITADLLAPADPYAMGTVEPDSSLRRVVERTANSMEERFREDPQTRVVLHRAIAGAYSGWGEYEKAVSHLDRARALLVETMGTGARESVPIDIALCQNLRLAGDTRRGERICLRAETVARDTSSPLLGAARISRAKLLVEIGEYDKAANTLSAALEDGARLSPAARADAEWFYGLSLRKLARFEMADGAFRRHLTMRQTLHGAEHPLTAWAHADYGDFLVAIGDYAAAEKHLARAQIVFDRTLGADHPESLSPAYSRAIAYLWKGAPVAARDILRPMLARYRETLGADHYWTLYTMTELALAEALSGEREIAGSLLHEARRTGIRILYGRNGKAPHFHMRWARTLAALGRANEADEELRRARAAMDKARYEPDHPWRAELHCVSSRIALLHGRGTEASRLARACLSGLESAAEMPKSYPVLGEARALLKIPEST